MALFHYQTRQHMKKSFIFAINIKGDWSGPGAKDFYADNAQEKLNSHRLKEQTYI